MATYDIEVTKTQREHFTVQADSLEDAKRLADRLFESDSFISMADYKMDEFYDPDWEVSVTEGDRYGGTKLTDESLREMIG